MALVAALFGCAGPPPSLATWVADVEGVCNEYRREAERFPAPDGGPGFAVSLERVAELAAEEADAVRSIPRPDESEDRVLAWLDALQRRSSALTLYAARLRTTPSGQAVEVPPELAAARARAEELSDELGLVTCGAGVELVSSSPTSVVPPAAGTSPVPTGIDGSPTDETTTQDR